MIDFTLLGTAALLPLPDRALTAGVLRYKGLTVLFDCGEGTQAAARKAGVNIIGADMIALSHYHGDHIFGLPGLLQTMLSMGRTEPLPVLGPKGLRAAMKPVLALSGPLPFPVLLREMKPGESLPLDGLDPSWPAEAALSAIPTAHRVPSCGYAFRVRRAGRFLPEKAEALGLPKPMWGLLQKGESVSLNGRDILPGEVTGPERKGLKLVFTGDTSPCPALTEGAKDADLLICEATYGDDADEGLAKERGHMTFAQAGRLARDAGVQRLWLSHFSQKLKEPAEYLPAARQFFPDAVCGADGMSIHLGFTEFTEDDSSNNAG